MSGARKTSENIEFGRLEIWLAVELFVLASKGVAIARFREIVFDGKKQLRRLRLFVLPGWIFNDLN